MTRMLNPTIRNSSEVDVTKPEKVQRLLDTGWTLAEGETFVKPKEKRKSKELKVDERLSGDGEDNIDNQGTGADIGRPLGKNDAVITRPNGTKVMATNTPGTNLPGLSGKGKEALIGIAKDENIAIDVEAAKPLIKAAIEAERAKRSGEADDTSLAPKDGDEDEE